MLNNNIIQVENIQRHLPQGGRELHILNGISFAVEAGFWLALTGPSGSGKSTLLGILAGIDRPSGGKVYVEGTEISALPEGQLARLRNEKIGIVFQSFHLIPTMTALENVEAPLYIHPQRLHARSMAVNMLNLVGLGERMDHFPHQLSGGEQQRVAIARALVCGPDILLADEPTGNLDTATSKQVLDLIRQLRSQLGLTVIMVTHDLADAIRHANIGEAVINPRVAARLVKELHGQREEAVNPFSELTNREMDVLRQIAAGQSNHEIAAALVISEKTVKSHITNILNKQHLSDRTQAAVYAWQEGIVRRDQT